MNYHLHRQGANEGEFPLEDLRRRREAGELRGDELIWREGMSHWQALDFVLYPDQGGFTPGGSARKTNVPLLVGSIIAALVIGVVVYMFQAGAARFLQRLQSRLEINTRRVSRQSDVSAMRAASKPVTWNTNTMTETMLRETQREFRVREYLEAYKQSGRRDPSYDADALLFLQTWIATHFGRPDETNLPSLTELGDKLANNPACDDPVILTVAGVQTVEQFEATRRLERAVSGFENSKYKAYPRFYATVMLASQLSGNNQRVETLDASALQLLGEALNDGSLLPEDQAEVGDKLVLGWAYNFFYRNRMSVYELARVHSGSFPWFSLVIQGEYHIMEAWRLRGGGYANTVTEEGWRGFQDHLAEARSDFTKAWKLHPELPLAPCRMIYVSLGDSDIGEMREWFDRTVAAQLDYSKAWSDMRWGLRPRWYGDYDSMLAFGVTAVNTRRFDTDVPRKFFDVVSDLESEYKLPLGTHIYGQKEIWPHLQELYEGYIAESAETTSRYGWRSTYSAIAHLGGKYDVARAQLEAINWKPRDYNITGWGTDLSLMPLEVAARTSPFAKLVDEAESKRKGGDIAEALKIYSSLPTATGADQRTVLFVQDRLVTLEQERRLQEGGWVDFLPSANFAGWRIGRGRFQVLSDGALEVQSDAGGHIIYSRARVGMDFEVKGSFEVVRSSSGAFQAGLVMGIPEFDSRGWYSYRMKRNNDEGEIAAFATHWTKNGPYSPVSLNSRTNSFYFRLRAGSVSASVNGREVLKEVPLPRNSSIATNEFMLGLGAFNDVNDTVIRCRDVQVREISPR